MTGPNTPQADASGRSWAIATLLVVTLVMGSFVVFGNSYWDARMYDLAFKTGDYEFITRMFISNGRPLGGISLLAAYQWLGSAYGPVALATVCIVAGTMAVYATARLPGLLPPPQAAVLALFVGLTPAHQMMLSASSLHFHVGYALLFWGLYLFCAAETRSGWVRWAHELGALVTACLAAALAESATTMLALYPLVRTAIHWAAHPQQPHGLKQMAVACVRYSLPMLAGVATFVTQFKLFPALSYFVDERTVGLQFTDVIESLTRFAVAIVICYLPVIWTAGCLSATQWGQRRCGPTLQRTTLTAESLWLIGLSALSLFLAVLPYLFGNRKPTVTGWSVRFLLFTGLGLGLLAVLWLNSRFAGADARARRMAAVLLMVCLVAGMGWRWPLWAARLVKDDAIAAYLHATPAVKQAAVVCIRDYNPSIAGPYRPDEWTGMFQYITGKKDQIAIQANNLDEKLEIRESVEYFHLRTNLVHTKPEPACQFDMLIPEPNSRWPVTVALGMIKRHTQSRASYEQWLLGAYSPQGAAR